MAICEPAPSKLGRRMAAYVAMPFGVARLGLRGLVKARYLLPALRQRSLSREAAACAVHCLRCPLVIRPVASNQLHRHDPMNAKSDAPVWRK